MRREEEEEEKGDLTDGKRQIDKEKQGMALGSFLFLQVGLRAPRQSRVIIPCQAAGSRVAFFVREGVIITRIMKKAIPLSLSHSRRAWRRRRTLFSDRLIPEGTERLLRASGR